MKHTCLFPDDTELFRRTNLERKTTPMSEIAEYSDGISNQIFPQPFVIRQPDGLFRMVYPATLVPSHNKLHYFTAVSEDGIHFRPDAECAKTVGVKNPVAPNQYMDDLPDGCEIFDIFEDTAAEQQARYKMLYTLFIPDELRVDDRMRISADGVHWKEVPTVHWHSRGSEPVGSVTPDPFHPGAFLIMTRPEWGDRRITMIRTEDWENFSAPQLVMAPDSMDEPMAEHYGLRAFRCGDMLFGFLMVYKPGDHESLHYKFHGGPVQCELVYSRNGNFWQRTNRKTFIGGEHKMFWTGTLRTAADETFLYANAAEVEHGAFYTDRLCCSVRIFRTPRDRFISLAVKPGSESGVLATRQFAFHGGDLCWNIHAEQATCAIYEPHGHDENPKILRSHEDCIPFSGDSTNWKVCWKSHDNLDDLKGKMLVFELKMKSGEVWGLTGDFTPLKTTEAFRYDTFGILPTRRGF